MRRFKEYSRYSQQLQNPHEQDWKLATATVVACRRSFSSFFEAGTVDHTGGPATPTTYVTTFEYKAEGKKYYGKTKRGTPVAPGHRFTISYDPNRPDRNTGSDNQGPWWFHLMAWSLMLVVVGLLIYLDRLMKP